MDVLDSNVAATLQAQAELKTQIALLQVSLGLGIKMTNVHPQADLRNLSANQGCPLNLETYINKLNNSKKRVTVVANILATAQDRLNRVHQVNNK